MTELFRSEIDSFSIFARLENNTKKFLIEWTANSDYQRMKGVEERLKSRITETMDWGQVFRKTMIARVGGVLLCSFARGVLQVSLEIPEVAQTT